MDFLQTVSLIISLFFLVANPVKKNTEVQSQHTFEIRSLTDLLKQQQALVDKQIEKNEQEHKLFVPYDTFNKAVIEKDKEFEEAYSDCSKRRRDIWNKLREHDEKFVDMEKDILLIKKGSD